jgi:chorismate dehydratase
MAPVRLGAVEYLNARPLLYGLERQDRFMVRYDLPSRCADLLHDGAIDVGLIPSIEYLRGGPYRIVPGLAIASHGPVASVALYTKRPMRDVRSIALDTSSRTSVALVRVLCAQLFRIEPAMTPHGPDLGAMLATADAALIIGDNALFLSTSDAAGATGAAIVKIDLGEAWFELTGLPFVYAFWAGRPGALDSDDVAVLQQARDAGILHTEDLARAYLAAAPERQALGARYLQDNIQYMLGDKERAGLQIFYRYAAELGIVDRAVVPAFYDER